MSQKREYFLPLSASPSKKQVEQQEPKWLQQLCRGEEEGYRVFFEEYYQVLGVFAMKYVKEKEAAEDIVQDVILELYSRRLRFDSVLALKSWLFTSVKNKCVNHIRHLRSRERYLRDIGAREEGEFFLDRIIEEEIYFLLKKAVCGLADPVRRIYELSLKGHSNEEIAVLLDLTLDSVKSYKKRGKQILREQLKGLMGMLSVGTFFV